MRNLSTKLTVLHDDNGTFEDHSDVAHSFIRDTFVFDYTTSEDVLYVGFRKPISAFYVEMSTENGTTANLSIEYFKAGDTNAFTSVSKFIDETDGLQRSGFIQWERDQTDEDETTINGTEQYWYKLTWDATLDTATEIKGLNTVFSDDQDLIPIVPSITQTKYLATDESSHILAHVGARDHILKRLSEDGRLKANFSSGVLSELNQFDILNINQLREASKFKALSIIFQDLSDEPGDNYRSRATAFETEFEAAYNKLSFLDVDWDDDGKSDRFEEMQSATPIMNRR